MTERRVAILQTKVDQIQQKINQLEDQKLKLRIPERLSLRDFNRIQANQKRIDEYIYKLKSLKQQQAELNVIVRGRLIPITVDTPIPRNFTEAEIDEALRDIFTTPELTNYITKLEDNQLFNNLTQPQIEEIKTQYINEAFPTEAKLSIVRNSPTDIRIYVNKLPALTEADFARLGIDQDAFDFVILTSDDEKKERETLYPNGSPKHPNGKPKYPKNSTKFWEYAGGHPTNNFTNYKAAQFYTWLMNRLYKDIPAYIQLYPRGSNPYPYMLFDGESNCVLEIIKNKLNKLKPNKNIKQALKYIAKLDLSKTGFTPEHAKVLYEKYYVPLKIYNNYKEWESFPPRRGDLGTIEIFAHDDHATVYEPLKPIKNTVIMREILPSDLPHTKVKLFVENINDIQYTETKHHIDENGVDYDCEGSECTNCNDLFNFTHIEPHLLLKGYHIGDTLYKKYQPYNDDQTPDLRPEYATCMNQLSYEHKKFINKYNLRPPTGIYYDMLTNEHYLSKQLFQPFTAGVSYHNSDIVKAFRSYKHNKYYPKYKLPVGNYNLVKITNLTTSEIVDLPGWSTVSNVQITDPLVEKIQWIQSDCLYPHVVLRYILDNKCATFDIYSTVMASSEDIDLGFSSGTDLETKLRNNSRVGKLIQQPKSTYTYISKSADEISQIIHQAMSGDDYIGHTPYGDKLVQITTKTNTKTGLPNLHSYITAYTQITLIDAMRKVPLDTIIGYNTDGFFTTTKPKITYTEQLHGFKYSCEPIKWSASYEHDQHVQAPPHEPIPFELQSNKTNHTFTNGPAGCGKSRGFTTNPYYGSFITAPTHVLCADLKSKVSNVDVSTIQKYIASWQHTNRVYENLVVDEATMLSKEVVQVLNNHAFAHRYNIHWIGDLDNQGNHQILPSNYGIEGITATPLQLSDFDHCHKYTIVAENRRQSTSDCVILDSMRGKTYQEQLAIISRCVKTVSIAECIADFDQDSWGLSGLNDRCAVFNKKIEVTAEQNIVKVCKKTTTNIKGSRITVDKSIQPHLRTKVGEHNKLYEYAFFTTVDAAQGATHSGKLFIDVRGMDRQNLLYTAVTRCTKLSNVRLVI